MLMVQLTDRTLQFTKKIFPVKSCGFQVLTILVDSFETQIVNSFFPIFVDHLTMDGRHFFRECCRNADGLWFIWVYLLGTQKEADNYVYTIKITSEDKEEELAYRYRNMISFF